MLKNPPPGTEFILYGLSIITSIVLVFGMMYSWFVLKSDMVTMLFVGFIVFVIIMSVVYYVRRNEGEKKEEDESESDVSLSPDESFED